MKLHSFLHSVLDEGTWWTTRPVSLYPWERYPVHIKQENNRILTEPGALEKRSNSCCWRYSRFSVVKPDGWKDVIFLCDGWSNIVFLRRFTATLAILREPRVLKIDQLFPRPVKPLSHPPTRPLTSPRYYRAAVNNIHLVFLISQRGGLTNWRQITR